MIVAKFGGTSMATAAQIKKACDIMLADSRRKIMVVSAPGKRFSGDDKITDLLIALAHAALDGQETGEKEKAVTDRYAEIISGLNLSAEAADEINADIKSRLAKKNLPKERFLDLIKASGEDNCAKIVARYLSQCGAEASYVNPQDAGMILTDKAGGGRILPQSYNNLYNLRLQKGIIVFPGFFGVTAAGDVVTFSRGGSDVTGSILAAGTQADLYENFTDVDHIFAADPSVIKNPAPVSEITYWQMRELAYAGFGIFHEEAVEPVVRARIPIHIKNTNNPAAQGTKIVYSRDITSKEVIAIAGTGGFCNLTTHKFLMNSEIGFGRRLFQILEEEGVSFDHAPSGIDNISPIIRKDQLSQKKLQSLAGRIKSELNADSIEITHDLALVVIVCETVYATKSVVSRAVGCLTAAEIGVSMLNMTSGSLSLTVGVSEKDLKKAIEVLYKEFF